jgi:hypothetical protein
MTSFERRYPDAAPKPLTILLSLLAVSACLLLAEEEATALRLRHRLPHPPRSH